MPLSYNQLTGKLLAGIPEGGNDDDEKGTGPGAKRAGPHGGRASARKLSRDERTERARKAGKARQAKAKKGGRR